MVNLQDVCPYKVGGYRTRGGGLICILHKSWAPVLFLTNSSSVFTQPNAVYYVIAMVPAIQVFTKTQCWNL